MPVGRPRILICEPRDFSPAVVNQLRAHADVELRTVARSELPRVMNEFDVLWLRLAHTIDAPLIAGAERCRIVATPVTGIDHIDLDACRQKGVRVVSLKGEVEFLKDVRATAEMTMGLLLSLMRRVPSAAESVKRGEWRRDEFRGHELHGKTMGVLGMGRLGRLVAGYCQAFGMRVIGYDVRDVSLPQVERVTSLDALLRQSDVLSIHVDLNDGSRGLIGANELAQLPRGSWLVNTSRGGVLDDDALLRALDEGQLRGAALDVLVGEPHIDERHPVVRYAQGHPNLLLVPHVGGNTWESFEKTESFIAGKVLEALGR